MSRLFPKQAPCAGYAQIALEKGIDTAPLGLTYAVPPLLGDLQVGQRVIVPLGRRHKPVPGYIVARSSDCDRPAAQVKSILKRDPNGLSVPSDLVDLAQWMANYYCCPLGMVFATMLPAAVKRGTGRIMRQVVLLQPPEPLEQDAERTPMPPAQGRVLAAALKLARQGQDQVELRALADAAQIRTVGPVKRLIQRGLLRTAQHPITRVPVEPDFNGPQPARADHALTEAQGRALAHLAAHLAGPFSVHLLHGVTASGKTEVYLRAIGQLLDRADRSTEPPPGALVLVPEIALTGQTVASVAERFDAVAVLHSGLTSAKRNDQWRRIRNGEARIVVGTRSAVFAPVQHLGLIIVDEEHDSSYKQDQLPRYHARDVAIKRAQLLKIPVVLGSATPSLESYHHATCAPSGSVPGQTDTGPGHSRYHLIRLPQRVAGLMLPHVEIVDMRSERQRRRANGQTRGLHLVSLRLERLLAETVQGGGQAMLLLNRRGYANYIACPQNRCGWLANCTFCDATMVYHRNTAVTDGGYIRCHHCGAEQQLPRICPQCQACKPTIFGMGTQRVEQELERKFPNMRHLRMDSDTMHAGRNYGESLARFRRGAIDVLLGTQIIAKGLDFPNVRLVGIINADTALHLPDFRASERTFQLIGQVAGRAGRGRQPGRVIVQSFTPDDPAIVLAARHDYEAFAGRELALRRSVGLPPATRMARIVTRDRDRVVCDRLASRIAEALRSFDRQMGLEVTVAGPTPCPIGRIAEHFRRQIELVARPPQAAGRIQKLMTALRNARILHADAHTAVDVDPVAMM